MLLADMPTQNAAVIRMAPDESVNARNGHPVFDAASATYWETIRVEPAVYPLRRPLAGRFVFGPLRFQLCVDTLSPTFVGKGVSRRKAENNLKLQVHRAFQILRAKRPFQMTGEEQEVWAVLSEAIDVYAYERARPLDSREIGQVQWPRRFPKWYGFDAQGRRVLKVNWADGRSDWVRLDRAPAELAGYGPGQWIEAIVRRDPTTHDILRVIHVERAKPAIPMSLGQAVEYWDALPGLSQTKTETNSE